MSKLQLICGSSREDGINMFWVLDSSCSRLYVVPQATRVDTIADTLEDFIGTELQGVDVIPVDSDNLLTKRCRDIVNFLKQKTNKNN